MNLDHHSTSADIARHTAEAQRRDLIRQRVAEGALKRVLAEEKKPGLISGAVQSGMIQGFALAFARYKLRRAIRADMRFLRAHAKELLEWDVGDDGATAARVAQIAERLSANYANLLSEVDHGN